MGGSCAPEMSMVIVTPYRNETVQQTMQALRAQTAKDRLEIVIVARHARPR
jgi:hypothetical protein